MYRVLRPCMCSNLAIASYIRYDISYIENIYTMVFWRCFILGICHADFNLMEGYKISANALCMYKINVHE